MLQDSSKIHAHEFMHIRKSPNSVGSFDPVLELDHLFAASEVNFIRVHFYFLLASYTCNVYSLLCCICSYMQLARGLVTLHD